MPNWPNSTTPFPPRNSSDRISYAVNVDNLEQEFGVDLGQMARDVEGRTGRVVTDVSAVVIILCGVVFLVIVCTVCVWM